MELRDERDRHVIEEVIDRDTYDLRMIKTPPSVVVDIGAHIGSFAVFAHHLFPQSKIICVEPIDGNFELLQKNASFAELHHAAIYYGDNPTVLQTEWQTGSAVISEPRGGYFNEYLERFDPIDQRVTAVSLKSILPDGVGFLLKLDCEFAEYSILEEIIRERLGHKFSHVVGEYHLHNRGNTKRIRELLREAFPPLICEVQEGGFNNIFSSYS